MSELGLSDFRHLEAAQGWLGLNNWQEAKAETEQISQAYQTHPDVLQVKWAILAAARDWLSALQLAEDFRNANPDSPFGFVHSAYALHELKRTKEAQSILLPVVDKFSDEYIIRYNLACYACQLGDNEVAWRWVEKSMALADPDQIKRMAMSDPDLEPLLPRMRQRWVKNCEE